MNELPVIRNYDDLVAALVFQKNALGLSHEVLEEICGLTRGHVDKVFGRARNKSIGKWLFGILLEGLALELVPRINPEALKRMKNRYQRRNEKQVRNQHSISQEAIQKARPIILSEMARKGWQTRRARNGNGHANGHARP
jgi:hypothetical protein